MDPARSFATSFRLFDLEGEAPVDDRTALEATIDATARPNPSSSGGPAPLALPPPMATTTEGPRYDLRGLLGRGGMGEVRLARDRHIGREVAVKIARASPTSTSEVHARFLREALVQGQLEHPAIVPVYDVEVLDDGAAFFSMKRVRGRTLWALLADARNPALDEAERPTLRRLLSVLASVCLAVEFAHKKGVVHRDIKPANVMVGDFGEVYLLDWGLAKIVGQDDGDVPSEVPSIPDDAATLAGSVLGTPGYMAPEQIDSTSQAIGPAADVYALGAVLFEIVAGERFIAAPSVTDATIATLSGTVERRPSVRASGVVDAFDDVCARALARDPLQRPRARAVHDAIDAFLAGESDRERQRALSHEHLAQARRNDDSVDGRARALRSLGSAIALDPGNVEARSELLRLLTTAPSTTPPEVAQAVAADNLRRIRELARARRTTVLLQVPLLLAALLLDIQDTLAYAAMVAGVVLSLLLNTSVAARPSTTDKRLFFAHGAYLFAILVTMTYAGPLIVAPSMLVGFIAQTQLDPRPQARRGLLALGIAVFLLGFVLERTGHLGATYSFVDGRLLVSSGLATLDGGGLVVASLVAVASLLSTALVVGRARDEIAVAERRLHLQAWQSSQLASSTSRAP